MDKRRGDQAEGRASTPKDEPASPPHPRLRYQKTQTRSYKDERIRRHVGVKECAVPIVSLAGVEDQPITRRGQRLDHSRLGVDCKVQVRELAPSPR
jgi:hypothetical protein